MPLEGAYETSHALEKAVTNIRSVLPDNPARVREVVATSAASVDLLPKRPRLSGRDIDYVEDLKEVIQHFYERMTFIVMSLVSRLHYCDG